MSNNLNQQTYSYFTSETAWPQYFFDKQSFTVVRAANIVNYVGFKQIGIPFERPFRKKGKSKSSYSFLINYSFDSLFSFSNVPINLIIKFGFLLFVLIVFFGFFLIVQKIFG
jgi:hypothetical protein